ncbi:MAG: bifunctional ADP-dependent NAD(P)H-hydrate dehydratase/NAD(P)H-hydrate epimerase, partial [Thermoplasmata archaeon]
ERDCGGRVILTPHAGEFRKLTGVTLPDELGEKRRAVEEEAKKRNATILLKGSVDIISNGEKTKMNRIHNEAMTVGGTGDVLAGICAALLAKGLDPFHAACLGAMMNGMAGNLAFEERRYGMVATDMVERIPEVIKKFVE